MTRVIGLAGNARAGKDTVADYLAELTPGSVERDAFADRLKLIAAKALDVTFHPDDVGTEAVRRWADHIKQHVEIVVRGPFGTIESKVSGRRFLQRLGAEGIRDVLGADVLVDALPLDRDCDLLIVTDVRFPNEAEAIRAAGGEVWRVDRPGVTGDGHVSEQRIEADRVIENDGTLDDLRDRVREAL
jgi:hypothetical protein